VTVTLPLQLMISILIILNGISDKHLFNKYPYPVELAFLNIA